jgi:ADP-ribose pyrophosphatase YjhB (NUDIX family)
MTGYRQFGDQEDGHRALRLRFDDDGALVPLRCSVLFFRDDSVLLCRRTDLDDIWVLPGGTPRTGESSAAAGRREVLEETGLDIAAERVAFVLETSDWERTHHLIEIVFLASERDRSAVPQHLEEHLEPAFVSLDTLGTLKLRPSSITGYIRGFVRSHKPTAAYLGNLWRPENDAPSERFIDS